MEQTTDESADEIIFCTDEAADQAAEDQISIPDDTADRAADEQISIPDQADHEAAFLLMHQCLIRKKINNRMVLIWTLLQQSLHRLTTKILRTILSKSY